MFSCLEGWCNSFLGAQKKNALWICHFHTSTRFQFSLFSLPLSSFSKKLWTKSKGKIFRESYFILVGKIKKPSWSGWGVSQALVKHWCRWSPTVSAMPSAPHHPAPFSSLKAPFKRESQALRSCLLEQVASAADGFPELLPCGLVHGLPSKLKHLHLCFWMLPKEWTKQCPSLTEGRCCEGILA
jgi:hypothetical protein